MPIIRDIVHAASSNVRSLCVWASSCCFDFPVERRVGRRTYSRACRASRYRQIRWTFVVRLDRVLAVDLDPPCGACAAPPNYCPIRKTIRGMTQPIVTPYAVVFSPACRGRTLRATHTPRFLTKLSQLRQGTFGFVPLQLPFVLRPATLRGACFMCKFIELRFRTGVYLRFACK